MSVLTELCLNCLGCNKLGDPNFLGVQECENCTLNQVIKQFGEQIKMEGIDENT